MVPPKKLLDKSRLLSRLSAGTVTPSKLPGIQFPAARKVLSAGKLQMQDGMLPGGRVRYGERECQ